MLKLTYEEVEETIDKLSDQIIKIGFKPDFLVGVATGGLIPLALLAQKLGIKKVI